MGKVKSSAKRTKLKQAETFSEAANEQKRIAKEEELALKAAQEELEKQRVLELQQENEEYHNNIINDYIGAFVDHQQLQNIQNEQDLEEMEEMEAKKPKHDLTHFLEVLLHSETNKKGLHQILTDQFLDNPDDFEALITADDVNWSETDYGTLNPDEWELDDDEVKRLMNEWQRSILDPVMNAYTNRKMPFAPEMPVVMEIYDDFSDSDKEKEEIDKEHDDIDEEKEEEIIETKPKKIKKQKKTKSKKKKKEKIEEIEDEKEEKEENEIDDEESESEEENEEPHIETEEEE